MSVREMFFWSVFVILLTLNAHVYAGTSGTEGTISASGKGMVAGLDRPAINQSIEVSKYSPPLRRYRSSNIKGTTANGLIVNLQSMPHANRLVGHMLIE